MTYPTYVLDTYALTTVGACKEHLNIKDTDTSQDNIITRMINSASEMIEIFLDRKVKQRSFTEYFDGRGNDRILLRQWPVVKPTEVWDDPGGLFTTPSNKLPTDQYDIEGDPGIGIQLLNGRQFSKGSRNIKVIYQGGYSTIPYVIHEAAILFVEYMYDMRADRRIGVQTKGKNQESTTFLGDLPDFVKNMIEPYQRCEQPLGYIGVQNT